MAFKWIRKTHENGAKIMHVDPRFTRTSAAADMYARIGPGTDAAFQNAMINHILVNKLYDEDYVVTHTNALFLGDEAFDFKDGVFSGFDPQNHKYHAETWGYQLDARGKPPVAKSLDDPHCVFSRLKIFASRYTPETGEQITGIPAKQIQQIAETMAKNRRDPSSTRSERPSTRPACRGSGRSRSYSSCSATSASRAAASMRCAASRTCRAPATWRCSTTI
jgi:formate dehydrogenase major subunit